MRLFNAIFFTFFFTLLAFPLYCSDHYPVNAGIDVTAYSFSLYLSDSYDMIKGEAEISLSYKAPAGSISLDLINMSPDGKGMTVRKVWVDNQEAEWAHENNKLVIRLAEEGGQGTGSVIRVLYSGIPRDGLIISTNRHGDRTFFADNWPDRARNWIPCIDHPSDKAKVEFLVYAPSHYSVVANGIKVEETLFPDGIRLTHWKEEVSIPTKVMVIGVARFASRLNANIGGIEIWSWVFPEDRDRGFSDYAIASEPFTFYSNTLGSYPYEKLANVQSKTIFGGMENAGCIFYSERSVTGKNNVERLMAHEIAHQWFGNSVTESDWHHIWLSEGFATYFTSFYMEKTYGELKMRTAMQHARNRISTSYLDRPAPVIDTTITDFMKLLNNYSYQKGAWFLHMLRDRVGDADFLNGVKTYYNRYRNRNALTSDFRKSMEDVCGCDLDDFFYQWLYCSEIPVLSMNWSYDRLKNEIIIKVTQEEANFKSSFPLEIGITVKGIQRLESYEIDEFSEEMNIKVEERPSEVVLDPRVKLLFIEGNN